MSRDQLIKKIAAAYQRSQTVAMLPRRWRINFAARRELMNDPDFYPKGNPAPIEERTLFGAAIVVIDDGNDQPTFSLHIEPMT